MKYDIYEDLEDINQSVGAAQYGVHSLLQRRYQQSNGTRRLRAIQRRRAAAVQQPLRRCLDVNLSDSYVRRKVLFMNDPAVRDRLKPLLNEVAAYVELRVPLGGVRWYEIAVDYYVLGRALLARTHELVLLDQQRTVASFDGCHVTAVCDGDRYNDCFCFTRRVLSHPYDRLGTSVIDDGTLASAVSRPRGESVAFVEQAYADRLVTWLSPFVLWNKYR